MIVEVEVLAGTVEDGGEGLSVGEELVECVVVGAADGNEEKGNTCS